MVLAQRRLEALLQVVARVGLGQQGREVHQRVALARQERR